MARIWILALVTAITLPACGDGAGEPRAALGDEARGAVPLYDNLGTHQYAISTSDPRAQQYFDQGLRLSYAFNHGEAIRAFEEAARLDPECAMCYWGIAYAYGPNINAPMDEEAARAAHTAVQRALALSERASPRERGMIEALATRYADPPAANQAAHDSAYARAMGELAAQHPEDHEIATLAAEARMNLRPWEYWTREGQPHPGTAELLASLERVIASNPNHPGACHFYIHAVEAAAPEKAVACAERLAGLMPGAGHLVHMPAHIYIRVGRWNDAIESNEHAVHADETYIADQRPSGLYPLAYYPHNYHFLSFAATMAGRSNQAIEAARHVSEKIDRDVARSVPDLQALIPYLHLTLVTFGRWDEVLREPVPEEDLPFSRALAQYARGVALAAQNRPQEARAELASLNQIRAGIDAEPARTVLEIAAHALEGEIAARGGQTEAAIAHFRAAMELEDGLIYMEPPFWYYPIRHSLGAVLLQAGRPAEAERHYREDLARFPENGWALQGLAQSLRAQGQTQEAAAVEQRLARVWDRADVRPTSSRF